MFGLRDLWAEIEALDGRVPAETQIAMLLRARILLERATRWLLRNRRRPLDIAATVARYTPGAAALAEALPALLGPAELETARARAAALAAVGVPPELAQRVAHLEALVPTFELVEIAAATELDVAAAAEVYFALGARLELHWLRDRIVDLPRETRWEAMARAALRDDVYSEQAGLTAEVLRARTAGVERWQAENASAIERSLQVLADIRSGGTLDLARLSVAVREMRNLIHSSGAPEPAAQPACAALTRADFPARRCHDGREGRVAMDTLGRDDELRTIHAFLDRPAPDGMAALVLEGEAGIGKSTLWLAGVEAARERGLRVLSSRPAEVELGVAHAALGDLLEDALADVLPELSGPRRRALETALLIEEATDEPVDARTLAVAVRDALHLLAEREPILVAIDDVQWLDASSANALVFAVRRLPEQNIRLLLARRLGGRHPGVGARARARRPQARARAGRPAQPGRAARDPARPARPGVRAADPASPARSIGRERVLRARARPCPRHGRRSDTAAAGPGDAGGARPRSPRRAARRDAPSAAARLHARPADARTAGR